MKKLLSFCCCILYMHTIAGGTPDLKITSPKVSGEKVLVKAFIAIVKRDNDKKKPLKKIQLPPAESK